MLGASFVSGTALSFARFLNDYNAERLDSFGNPREDGNAYGVASPRQNGNGVPSVKVL